MATEINSPPSANGHPASQGGAEENVSQNPYLAVVGKKLRNLKKKMERIRALEQEIKKTQSKQKGQAAQQTQLNEEQLALLNSKASVQKAIADIEALRQQLEEVAMHDSATKAPRIDRVEVSEPEHKAQSEPVPETVDVQEVPAGVSEDEVAKRVEDAVAKVLRLLHFSTRPHALASPEIPMELNFLAQTVLGQTVLPHVSFENGLDQSVQHALRYINDTEFTVVDRSYRELAALACELSQAKPAVNVQLLQTEPEFNFFAHERPHDASEVTAFHTEHSAQGGYNETFQNDAWTPLASYSEQQYVDTAANLLGDAGQTEATGEAAAADGTGARRGRGGRGGRGRGGPRRAGRGSGAPKAEGETKEKEAKEPNTRPAKAPAAEGEHQPQQQRKPHKPRNAKPKEGKAQPAAPAGGKAQQA